MRVKLVVNLVGLAGAAIVAGSLWAIYPPLAGLAVGSLMFLAAAGAGSKKR